MSPEERCNLVRALEILGWTHRGLMMLTDRELWQEARREWAQADKSTPEWAWRHLHSVFGDRARVEGPTESGGFRTMVGNKRIAYVSKGYCKDPRAHAQRHADEYNEKGYITF